MVCDLEKGGTQRAAQNFGLGYKGLGYDSRIVAVNGLGSRYEQIADRLIVYNGLQDPLLAVDKNWMPDLIHIHSHALSADDVNEILDLFRGQETKVVETNVFSAPTPWEKELDISFQLSRWAQWLYHLRGGLKSVILSNPINLDSFTAGSSQEIAIFRSENGIPSSAFVIGRIGENYEAKWSTLLIDIFEEFASKNSIIYLLLVNPPESIKARALASAYSSRLKIIEKIDGDKKLSIAYSAMNVMVHIAGIGESFGYVLPEAVLCGTPVITISTPWADNSQGEVLRSISGGYVVNRYATLVSVLGDLIAGKRQWLRSEESVKKFKDNYGYLELSRKSIDLAFGVGDSQVSVRALKKKDILKVSDGDEDKCSIFFKILFLTNYRLAVRLGPYATGYMPIKFLPKKIINAIKKRYNFFIKKK